MKIPRLAVFLLALLGALISPLRTQAREAVSFDFFYDSLAPYGDWIEVDDYGLCWQPTGVDPNWSPYTDGYWAYTDAGWTWVSYEDYGGIVYHYGRWLRLQEGRWCWVPDYEWAPAWVSWRYSDDYVGWAPLPPWARWRRDVGISVWADSEYDIGPGYYRFCHTHDFGAPVLRGVMIDPGENFTVMLGTTNVTNITYNMGYAGGPVIFNGGPDLEVINRFSARRVPTLKLVQNTNVDPAMMHGPHGARGALSAHTVGNQLVVAAPLVTPPTNPAALASRAKRTVAGVNVSKGWTGVKNPDAQRQLREQIQRQSKGLTPATAPARVVGAPNSNLLPKGEVGANPNATPGGEKHDKGRQPHFESQPTPPAPSAPTAGGVPLKPFNPSNEPGPKTKSSAPTAETSRTETPHPQDQEKMRAEQARAEQQKAREDQARAAQQHQAENAARVQENVKQQQEAAKQQQAARMQDATRQQEAAKEQQAARMQEAAKGKEAARNQADDARRHEEERRAMETRHAQEKAQPQPQPQPQQNGRGNPPPSNPQNSQGSQHPGKDGHSKDSKDSKDKDKDKNGN